MKKTTAFLMGTVALVASIEIASAKPQLPTARNPHAPTYAHRTIYESKAKTLYDQMGEDEGIAIVSQNFESSFDQYDSQGADDFVVPVGGGNWRVQEVDVVGQYFNGAGPATSENVFFYKDHNGLPGRLIHHFYLNLFGTDNGTGSFSIKLGGAGVKLVPGHYWVSVQINLDFNVGGEWGWEKQTTVVGNRAAWQNPGDGFGTGCTTWGIEDVCIPEGAPDRQPLGDNSGDKMFVLKGKTKGG